MERKPGRQDPCPCGSGKELETCCGGKSEVVPFAPRPRGRFRFEPGSYGGGGAFMPSVACWKRAASAEESHHYVLVKPDSVHETEEEAVSESEGDLGGAFSRRRAGGSDADVAEELRDRGYVRVSDESITGDASPGRDRD